MQLKHALKRQEDALGQRHLATLDTVSYLAEMYEDQNDFTQAAEFYERAYHSYKQILGNEHEYTVDCLRGLSRMQETNAGLKASTTPSKAIANERRSIFERLRRSSRAMKD